MDPYEQQLLTVFDSFDPDHTGSLDKTGLIQLCQTLHLEDQSAELIRSLLNDRTRASFCEFKEALLTLLGNMQLNKPLENGSPDREVSPKYVYGTKKYGRRSRPKNDELATKLDEENVGTSLTPTVQRSNSQCEVSNSKKRKTNYKLKRCTSLPSGQKIVNFHNEAEDMLREAWKKLGVGQDGYLDQSELTLVCEAIGLDKLATGLIRQLSLDYNHKISFQELLEALQLDDTWSDVINAPTNKPNLSLSNEIFPDSRTFQFVTLGPDGNGLINTETLIEMWEQVGISGPKELIHELGFNSREIKIGELAVMLEKEIKGIQDSTNKATQNPHIALLNANLTLYQSEIRCLKQILEQFQAEREKLKYDIYEANNRADLLAQEVDDNHLKMERNTQNQVKLLEQRHSDILKELSQQYSSDKEHMNSVNRTLNVKIETLEQEVSKLKHDLIVAQKYSNSLESENHGLLGRISDLQQTNDHLADQIARFDCERQKFGELEQEQIEPLLTKLAALELENAHLRDRNDEMAAEVESLSGEMASLKARTSLAENLCEGVGLGAKRRSDSPSKDGLFGIAMQGTKVRKFQTEDEAVPFASNESGFEAEIDVSFQDEEGDELTRLQAKVAFLEQILRQHSIPISNDSDRVLAQPSRDELQRKIHCLENTFMKVNEIARMIRQNSLTVDNLQIVGEKLEMLLKEATPEVSDEKSYEERNKMLEAKCGELESCVELLRAEYEKCEDYWQMKLEEERQIFEQEQSQSSDKLNDLINKLEEYEEQFASQSDERLPPIEESFNLEKQFMDLEQEFEHYKVLSEKELQKRDEEIAILRKQLTTRNECHEIGVQASRMSQLTHCIVEATNVFSTDVMPVVERNAAAPCRPKRTRKHERNNVYRKQTEEAKRVEEMVSLPVNVVHGFNARVYHLEQRCRQLQMVLKQQHFLTEQTLQQYRQHHRGEKTELQCIIRNHQEKIEQQMRIGGEQLDRLARSDMLVKELYIENSYLIAKVQRLEEHCHMLTQCENSSSV